MNRLILSTILSITCSVTALAADTGTVPNKSSDFKNMMTSLSNMLSSTNPKTTKYQKLETAAGENQAPETVTKLHVNDLPPLPGTKAKAAPIPEPQMIAQPEPDVEIAKLSQQTKNALRATPSGIGDVKKAPFGRVKLERGDFDPEYGKYINDPIDANEKNIVVDADKITQAENGAPKSPKATSTLDIKMQSGTKHDSIITTLEQALRALNAGQYEGAIALYKNVLEKDAKNLDALFGIATSYQKAGQKPQARAAYAQLLKAYPGYEPGLNNLLVMASSEAPQDALKELDAIGARNPNFATVYAQKGAIYSKLNDFANAKKNLVRAVELEPDNIVYRYNLAVLLDRMGDAANATKLYGQILDLGAKGANLPISRDVISERMVFLGSQRVEPNKL